MSRLALVVALVASIVVAPVAHAAKPTPPPPAPKMVAAVEGSWGPSCGALFAIDDGGTVYVDCGIVGNWQIAGKIVGKPVSMTSSSSIRSLLVTMENGDIWATTTLGSLPFTFTLLSNVFTAAGTGARLPDFPAPAFSMPPTSGAPDEPEVINAPGMAK